jgi:hypothetical protein
MTRRTTRQKTFQPKGRGIDPNKNNPVRRKRTDRKEKAPIQESTFQSKGKVTDPTGNIAKERKHSDPKGSAALH